MKAVRYYGKEDIRVEEIEEPVCKDSLVKIEPAFVGICGTDLHEYLGGPTFAPVKPHPVTGDTIPIVFGHEFSGVVTELGAGVKGLKVGQKVAVQPTIFCGKCGPCREGIENACPNGGFIGLSGAGGGLSRAVLAHPDFVFPLPDHIDLDVGALVEPLSVAWHAIDASPFTESSNVLVLGGGPIGLAVIQCLKAKGCKNVIVSEVAAKRQEFARDFGADLIVDPSKDDVVARCKELCKGDGPEIAFDCAGVPASIKTACLAIKSRGTVINVAIWEKEIPFNPNWLTFSEGTIKAVLGYQQKDFRAVVDHIASGALKPHPMITKKIKMDEVVEQGFMALINEKDKHVKILVDAAT